MFWWSCCMNTGRRSAWSGVTCPLLAVVVCQPCVNVRKHFIPLWNRCQTSRSLVATWRWTQHLQNWTNLDILLKLQIASRPIYMMCETHFDSSLGDNKAVGPKPNQRDSTDNLVQETNPITIDLDRDGIDCHVMPLNLFSIFQTKCHPVFSEIWVTLANIYNSSYFYLELLYNAQSLYLFPFWGIVMSDHRFSKNNFGFKFKMFEWLREYNKYRF